MSQEPVKVIQEDDLERVQEHEAKGPPPIGTLMVIAVLLLVTIAFWCLVLGIQQGRA